MKSLKKIAFLASPDFALPSLNLAFETFKDQLVVMTKPDKASGRGQKLQETPIKRQANDLGLMCYCPKTKESLFEHLKKINPTLVLVVAYGKILSQPILDRWLCLNVHPSLLPKYRGPAPIQATLLNQETRLGVSIIKLTQDMDAGPIVLQKSLVITKDDDAESLLEKSAMLGAELLLKATRAYLKDPQRLIFKEQNHTLATYSSLIKTKDAQLLKSDSSQQKLAKIRAFNKKPGAFIVENGKRIKILKASIQNQQLMPNLIQLEGKKSISYSDYLKGASPLAL